MRLFVNCHLLQSSSLIYGTVIQVADNATLYGVCIYVPEFIKEPPGITRLGSNKSHRHGPKPLGRFSLTTYRCYCLLTKLPFFDLHFEVLKRSIFFLSELAFLEYNYVFLNIEPCTFSYNNDSQYHHPRKIR